jgi:Flp pilus assembly protein TadB
LANKWKQIKWKNIFFRKLLKVMGGMACLVLSSCLAGNMIQNQTRRDNPKQDRKRETKQHNTREQKKTKSKTITQEKAKQKRRQDKTRQDKTRQESTKQDKARQGKARQLFWIVWNCLLLIAALGWVRFSVYV